MQNRRKAEGWQGKPPAAACSRCREDDASGRRSFHLFCQEKLKDAVAGLKRKWSAETRANVIALLEPWISCDEETKTSCCTICYCYLKEDAGLQLVTVEPVVSDEEYLPLLLTVLRRWRLSCCCTIEEIVAVKLVTLMALKCKGVHGSFGCLANSWWGCCLRCWGEEAADELVQSYFYKISLLEVYLEAHRCTAEEKWLARWSCRWRRRKAHCYWVLAPGWGRANSHSGKAQL